MRLKDRRAFSKPEVMIIPMIDIMFFLLVFFMLSTLYMVDLKTIPVNMPKVQNAQSQTNVNYLVTMKADGTLYLENKLIDEDTLLQGAKEKYEENNNFAVVIRADENVDYGKIMALLDKFKARTLSVIGILIHFSIFGFNIFFGIPVLSFPNIKYKNLTSSH